MARKNRIAAIWAIAKKIGMDTEDVHAVVYRETKKDSIRACADSEIEKVITALRYIGHMEEVRSGRATVKQKKYIKDLEIGLGWAEQPERLRAFLKKYYKVESVDWLSVRQASSLIESLKNLKNREREESK